VVKINVATEKIRKAIDEQLVHAMKINVATEKIRKAIDERLVHDWYSTFVCFLMNDLVQIIFFFFFFFCDNYSH
jgi:hypothetical protein